MGSFAAKGYMDKIDKFEGNFRFLSNFWPSVVQLDGVKFSSVEHAYQAAKTFDDEMRQKIKNAKTANIAKKLGQKVELRKDWESVKLDVMEKLLREKFAIPELKQLLLDTGDAELVEGNWWGDRFYGVCDGKGLNHLGRLLMLIRSDLKLA